MSVLGEAHGTTLLMGDCYHFNEKNLLEGIGISMDLVVVCTDPGDDSGDSNENANVHLRKEKERGAVRGSWGWVRGSWGWGRGWLVRDFHPTEKLWLLSLLQEHPCVFGKSLAWCFAPQPRSWDPSAQINI